MQVAAHGAIALTSFREERLSSDGTTFAAGFSMDALAVHIAIRHGAFFAFVGALVATHGAQKTWGHLRGRSGGC